MDIQVRRQKVVQTILESVGDLLQSRNKLGGSFTDSDSDFGANGEVGPVASLQGLRTAFGALAALRKERPDIWSRVVRPDVKELIEEWRTAIAGLRETSFNSKPYDPRGALKEILLEENPNHSESYTDAVSWALSTTVMMHFAFGLLAREANVAQDPVVTGEFRDVILQQLKRLLALQRPDGGWGWSESAPEGHLYFTWAAVGGFSDFYDYVAGDSPELGLEADNELLAFLDEKERGLVEQVNGAWVRSLSFVERYLDISISRPLTLADIYPSQRITSFDGDRKYDLAYYELYLLEMLVVLGYDRPGGKPSPSNLTKLRNLFESTRRTFKEVRSLDQSSSLDQDAKQLTLMFYVNSKKVIYKKPAHQFLVQDPGLWPQYVRAWNVYRFYSDRSSEVDSELVSEDDSALQLLLNDRRPKDAKEGAGLWDTLAFNLSLTARSVEGLVDAYDYLGLFEISEAKTDGLAATIADAVQPILATRLLGDERFLARLRAGSAGSPAEEPTSEPIAQAPPGPGTDDNTVFAKKLKLMFSNVLTVLPRRGLDADELLLDLLGQEKAAALKERNEDVYALLELIVQVNVLVAARLLPIVLREAVLTESDEEKARDYMDKDREAGAKRLHLRITMGIRKLMEEEMDGIGKAPDERMKYQNLVERALDAERAASSKSKKGR